MVMHARKTQRINDGYFEKHHQTHPYQNSKYSNSKGGYSDRYNDRGIRDSPNGTYRAESPDGVSPRDRSYQKIRHKERDNRDYLSSRDKYSDCSRSPKDKRRDEGRSNHERGEDRVLRVGDWTEHISSSGKKYYYNCKTEVSQWEKPREWVERDRRQHKEGDPRYLARLAHEKHSTPRGCPMGREVSSSSGASRGERVDGSIAGSTTCLKVPTWGRTDADDMDISPSSSTPRSDPDRRPGLTSTPVVSTCLPVNVSSAPSVSAVNVSSPVVTTAASASVSASLVPSAVTTSSAPNNSDEAPLTLEVPPATISDPGPPTPTHSENQDGPEPRKLTSPLNTTGTGAVSSSLLALRPTVPHLMPSLGNYFREALTDHIKNWPVHAIEKQVIKLSEEIHNITSIHCTRVSSELKTARAVVRLTEIQATLQEQRILFLRQQIKALEELNTQHSFMGD